MFAHAFVRQHPLLFKGVVPGTLAIGCGDVICQRLEGKEAQALVPERTARMMITGAVCVSPMAWFIQRSVNRALPGRSMVDLMKKSVVNAGSCVLFIVGSFAGNNLLQGRSANVLRAQLGERLPTTYALGFSYWTGANLLLQFVPQGLAAAVVANTLWSIAMSRALNAQTPAVAAALAAEEETGSSSSSSSSSISSRSSRSSRSDNSSSAFFHGLQRAGRQQQQQQQKQQQQQEQRH